MSQPTVRLKQLAPFLDLPYDLLKNVLNRGGIPPGMEPRPGQGKPRDFNLDQALWFCIVARLYDAGLLLKFAIQLATELCEPGTLQRSVTIAPRLCVTCDTLQLRKDLEKLFGN